MKKLRQTFILASLLAAAACASLSPTVSGPLSTDPDTLARQVIDAMGGRAAFKRARFLAWNSGARSYVWDRNTGRVRMETREGTDLLLVLFNAKTRQGVVGRNNVALSPSEGATLIAQSADRFASDAFWLLNVATTLDPGAHRAYAGEQEIDGRRLPTLQAGFDGRPDVYWFYIDPATHLPVAWTVALSGLRGVSATYLYAKMQKAGDLTLPAEYDQLGSDRKIVIGNLQILGSVEDTIFTQP